MGPVISPWPKLHGSRMGDPHGAHICAQMRPIWDSVGHVIWVVNLMALLLKRYAGRDSGYVVIQLEQIDDQQVIDGFNGEA